MRVIAGTARGRKLMTIDGQETRPTGDRVKEGMFSTLHFRLPGASVLDLFAGSGQLGIEALSRGASYCLFVDSARDCTNIIIDNLKNCGLFKDSRVACMDVFSFLVAKGDQFDIIVMDPPYAVDRREELLSLAAKRLRDGGVVLYESSADEKPPEKADGLLKKKEYRYGKTAVSVYEKETEGE